MLTGRGSVGDNLQSWCQQQISGFREDDPGLVIGQSLDILSSDWWTDASNWYQDLEKWEERARGEGKCDRTLRKPDLKMLNPRAGLWAFCEMI